MEHNDHVFDTSQPETGGIDWDGGSLYDKVMETHRSRIEDAVDEINAAANIDVRDETIKAVVRFTAWTVLSYLWARWMHRHIVPKHPGLMFPFKKRYLTMLEENNADYLVPSFFFGPLRPKRYGKFEEV